MEICSSPFILRNRFRLLQFVKFDEPKNFLAFKSSQCILAQTKTVSSRGVFGKPFPHGRKLSRPCCLTSSAAAECVLSLMSAAFSAPFKKRPSKTSWRWHWCSNSTEVAAGLHSSEVTRLSCYSVEWHNSLPATSHHITPFEAACFLILQILVENDRFETRHMLTNICNWTSEILQYANQSAIQSTNIHNNDIRSVSLGNCIQCTSSIDHPAFPFFMSSCLIITYLNPNVALRENVEHYICGCSWEKVHDEEIFNFRFWPILMEDLTENPG